MSLRYLSHHRPCKSCAWLLLAVVLFAAAFMGLTAGTARAQGDEAGRVTLFSGEGFSGAAQSWHLPPGRPYLSVPYIGEALDQSVASAHIGRDVGVVLFGLPHFAAKDNSCGPSLGGFQDSSLWWLGRTAAHLPARPSQNAGPLQMAKLESGAFASMIIYRRDIGPPPGALLLDRRPSYNRGCDSMLHTNNYNRLFTPVPDGPDRAACINVSATSASPGAGDKPPKFTRISELVLLTPARLDPAYRSLVHRTRIQLFDQANCQGNSIAFPRLRGATERFSLSDYQFRNKTRSALVTYESGPAEVAYSSPAPAPVVAAAPALPESEPELVQPAAPSLTANPVPLAVPSEDPAIAAPQALVPQIVPEAAVELPATPAAPKPAAEPASEPASVVPNSSVATTPAPEVEAAVSRAPAPEVAAAVSPAPASVNQAGKYSLQPPAPAPLPASELGPKVQEVTAQAPAPSQTLPAGSALQTQAAPLVVLPSDRGNKPEGVSQPVTAVQLPSETQSALTGSTVPPSGESFRFPVHKDYRLNFCYSDREDCGAPAAEAWCKTQGFSKALSWKKDANVGAIFPTVIIGTEDVCDKYLCDGFEEITCGS